MSANPKNIKLNSLSYRDMFLLICYLSISYRINELIYTYTHLAVSQPK